MAYINDDLPYDKYIEGREKGRAGKKSKRFGRKTLTCMLTFYVSPIINSSIERLIEKGIFPSKAEFLRYGIIKFFEENKEWLK